MYGEIKCPPIKDNHNGMFAGWAGTRKKGYDEFDIVMWDPVETASLRTLKHELLHAAGFAHVQHGVMNKYGVDGNQIDPVQLLNWKQAMKREVWHEIIPNCYNRPDLPDCG